MKRGGRIFLITQKNIQVEEPRERDLYRMGLIARIKQIVKMQNDIVRVIIDGVCRSELICFTEEKDYLMAQTVLPEHQNDNYPEVVREAMLRSLQEELIDYAGANRRWGRSCGGSWTG